MRWQNSSTASSLGLTVVATTTSWGNTARFSRSIWCWSKGLPATSMRILPGKRVEPMRASMVTMVFKGVLLVLYGLLPKNRGSADTALFPPCQGRVRFRSGFSETALSGQANPGPRAPGDWGLPGSGPEAEIFHEGDEQGVVVAPGRHLEPEGQPRGETKAGTLTTGR